MTIDTSVLVAIFRYEPERQDFITRLTKAGVRLVSTVSVLEATMLLEGNLGRQAEGDLDMFLHRAGIRVVPFDEEQLGQARRAFRRYGKGRHRAGLNFGDCAAYALAVVSGEPLLYKGTDFAATDVPGVIQLEP